MDVMRETQYLKRKKKKNKNAVVVRSIQGVVLKKEVWQRIQKLSIFNIISNSFLISI